MSTTTEAQSMQTMQKMTTEQVAEDLRTRLASCESYARNYIKHWLIDEQNEEVIEQATLAMRHIEDARMRYGKVLQYLSDGVSIYDK